MPYSLEDAKLRVFRSLCISERSKLKNVRLLVIEHVLPTTEEFLYLLRENGAEVHSFIAKPYSIDEAVAERVEQKLGIKIIRKTYDQLEKTDFIKLLLQNAINASEKDNKRIVIIDVGGYFSAALADGHFSTELKHVAGVVEDTTFGHNRYIARAKSINTRIFSVARSALKEIEARFVGTDAVSATESVLRLGGVSLPGRIALVIGYGMIGKNVARALRNKDLHVAVYDTKDHKNLSAFIDGYNVDRKRALLQRADLIFSATGNPSGALTFEEIEDCKDHVILASVGSKDTEFDVATLRHQAAITEDAGPHLKRYKLNNQQKRVYVIKDGTAVNFLRPSIPIEVLDLVFSEILFCVIGLVSHGVESNFGLHRVHDTDEDTLGTIAKSWLRNVNRQ